ncbi:MAG: sporulation integral membrane protein YtvI [Clostridia bacterium]|nr:sporulation integral membrane protein YtvI [Clostridia bacterium]
MKISENVKNLLIVTLTIVASTLLIYFAAPLLLKLGLYLFGMLSPFIFGYIFARLINPLADKLQNRLKLPRVASVVLIIILTIAALGGIAGGVIYKIYKEVVNFCYNWPDIVRSMRTSWGQLSLQWNNMYLDLPDSVQLMFDRFWDNLYSQAMTLVSDAQVINSAQSFAKALPGGIVWTVIFILTLFFMVNQKERVNALTHRIFKAKGMTRMRELRDACKIYLGGYVRAQLILMLIIFVVISIILSVFGAPYALFVAAATALLDALPVFGSGITLVPLSIIYFMGGNLKLGILYIATWLIVIIVRRFLEPKLVSDKMGLNPILTLVFMYCGYRWWGITGLLIGPIILMLLASLYKVGLFEKPLRVLSQLGGYISREIRMFINYLNKITRQEQK